MCIGTDIEINTLHVSFLTVTKLNVRPLAERVDAVAGAVVEAKAGHRQRSGSGKGKDRGRYKR